MDKLKTFFLDPGSLAGALFILVLWSVIFLVIYSYMLAKKNTVFTLIKEGTVKAIMKGEGFEKIAVEWDGHHINHPKAPWYNKDRADWEVLRNSTEDAPDSNPLWSEDKWNSGRTFLEKKFSIHWVGLPILKKVHTYDFEWTEETQTDEGAYKPRPRKARTNFIYVKDFPYHIMLKNVETSDNIPVNVHYVLTTRTNNPRKALFGVEDWLKKTIASSNSEVRNHVGAMSFEELTSEKHSKEKENKEKRLIESILCLNKALPSSNDPQIQQAQSDGGEVSLPSLYGITIIAADVQSIDPSGELGAKAKAALTRLYEAERENAAKLADAKMYEQTETIRAETDRAAKITRSEGQKEAYRNISSVLDGLKLREIDAYENVGTSPDTTVILGGSDKTNLLLGVNQERRIK